MYYANGDAWTFLLCELWRNWFFFCITEKWFEYFLMILRSKRITWCVFFCITLCGMTWTWHGKVHVSQRAYVVLEFCFLTASDLHSSYYLVTCRNWMSHRSFVCHMRFVDCFHILGMFLFSSFIYISHFTQCPPCAAHTYILIQVFT